MNLSRYGSACSSVSNASSSLRWRRKHRISEALDAQLGLRVVAGAVQAVDHGLHRHAAGGVRLRVEEHLGVHHVVGRRAVEVGPGHVVEVLLLQQHAGAGVVDVQEALQVGEGVGAAQRLDARRTAAARRCAGPARRSARARASPRCGCAARPWACARSSAGRRSSGKWRSKSSLAELRSFAQAASGKRTRPPCGCAPLRRAGAARLLLVAARHLAFDALDVEA